MGKFKLPNLKKEFRSWKKDKDSPYTKFYVWVGQQLPHNRLLRTLFRKKVNQWNMPEGKTFDVSHVIIHPDDDEMLTKLCLFWANRRYPFMRKTKLESSVAFLRLDIGPKTDDSVEPGYVYLEDGYMVEERDKNNG